MHLNRSLVSFVAGLLFGAGLLISGMTDPAKVVGFLDLAEWDPTLIFVMGGAILVALPAFQLPQSRNSPRFDARFHRPDKTDIDFQLLTGAALFGAGWGLSGLCPGPAIVSLPTGRTFVVAFILPMWLGLFAVRAYRVAQARRALRSHHSTPREMKPERGGAH